MDHKKKDVQNLQNFQALSKLCSNVKKKKDNRNVKEFSDPTLIEHPTKVESPGKRICRRRTESKTPSRVLHKRHSSRVT